MEDARRVSWWMLLVVLGVLLAQWLLVFNPGYFSHDELQWAVFAQAHRDCAFCNGLWTDVHAFQYRPLTFSVWMWLSQRLFVHPWGFHAVIAAAGITNAMLLAVLLRRTGLSVPGAVLGALVFALGPYAVFTTGWVATIAELIWVGCALGIGLLMQVPSPRPWRYAAVFALTTLALLAKETAVVIPALLACAWWFSGRRRSWGIATLVAALPLLIYLAIRLRTILDTPQPTGSIYAWGLAAVPVRWLEFQLFPLVTNRFGSDGLLADGFHGAHLYRALAIWLALAWALWRAGRRYLAAFLLVGAVALGPVLILGVAATWYGYGFSAAIAAIAALAWPRTSRLGRLVFVLAAATCLWHGIYIMRIMHGIGEKQSRFSPALAAAIERSGGRTVRLQVKDEHERWIYERLTLDIPSYLGVPIGDRVELVASRAPADYVVDENGHLQSLPPE